MAALYFYFPANVRNYIIFLSSFYFFQTKNFENQQGIFWLQGVTFGVFSSHMGVALTLIMFFVHFQLRWMFRNMKDLQYTDPKDVQGSLCQEHNMYR